MISIDVRGFNWNVDSVAIQVDGKVKCSDLVNECKRILSIDDGEYALKQNDVFVHPSEIIKDGESLIFTPVETR